MKLATFELDGNSKLGLVVEAGLIDVASHIANTPADMVELIRRWPLINSDLRRLLATEPDYALSDVHFRAPILQPSKILAIGMNYKSHLDEVGLAVPTGQVWFTKLASAINGPFDPIELPVASNCLDFEAEMVYVIGKQCRHVSYERAHEVIFGYCVGNDVSIRDWQTNPKPYPQFVLGKSFDTHAPFGPWITTADEVSPHNLVMRARINGQTRQETNTGQMLFDCYRQVEHLTKAITLMPGDVIYTGTPSGSATSKNPDKYLKEGDFIEIEVEGLGSINATVVRGTSSTIIL